MSINLNSLYKMCFQNIRLRIVLILSYIVVHCSTLFLQSIQIWEFCLTLYRISQRFIYVTHSLYIGIMYPLYTIHRFWPICIFRLFIHRYVILIIFRKKGISKQISLMVTLLWQLRILIHHSSNKKSSMLIILNKKLLYCRV